MKYFWFLVGLSALVIKSDGLQFSLTRDTQDLADGSSTCAVLFCQVKISSNEESVLSFKTISSLVVFQKVSDTKNGNADHVLSQIAAVKTNKPKYQQVVDGIKGYGHLEAGYAMLRLQVRKAVDCESEFLCQAEGVDFQGREGVATAQLVQQPKEKEDLRRISTSTSLQLLSLVQQISVKAALVERSQQVLENQLNVLEHRLEDKINDGFQKINDRMWEFESKINSPSRDFSQSKPVDILHNNKTLLEFLESTRRLEHILEDKTDLLSSLATSNTKTQTCEKIYQFITENLTADINEISNGSQALNRVVEDQMIEINDSFNTFLQSLEESINSSLSMTPSFPPKLISAPGNLGGDIITESPKVCKKNEGLKYKGEKYVEIEPVEDGLLQVPYLCDMISDGGGWIVIQHRATGDTDFFLGWEDYKEGFGSLDTDFWLGNDNIHALTSSGSWELNVEVKYKGDTREANYKDFSLGDEDSNYKLHIGTYSGTAGDSLSRHDGHPFTTKDKDNDVSDSRNCASTFEGAWWYINCHDSNLNGKWMSITAHHGLMWRTLTDSKSATFSEMKIRQVAP